MFVSQECVVSMADRYVQNSKLSVLTDLVPYLIMDVLLRPIDNRFRYVIFMVRY